MIAQSDWMPVFLLYTADCSLAKRKKRVRETDTEADEDRRRQTWTETHIETEICEGIVIERGCVVQICLYVDA